MWVLVLDFARDQHGYPSPPHTHTPLALLELFDESTFDICLLTPVAAYTQDLRYSLGVTIFDNRTSILCLLLEQDVAEVTERFCNHGG